MCGLLHCESKPVEKMEIRNKVQTNRITLDVGNTTCVSLVAKAGPHSINPGLVRDGTKCGASSVGFKFKILIIM